MVKCYASAKFAVGTKNRFKVHFQCGNWRLSQTEGRKCYAHSWSQEKHNQHQRLCQDFTEIANEKNIAKTRIQNFKRKKIYPL